MQLRHSLEGHKATRRGRPNVGFVQRFCAAQRVDNRRGSFRRDGERRLHMARRGLQAPLCHGPLGII